MPAASARTRRQLVKAIRDRYLTGSPAEKRQILDEFVALTGYHRKHAIRVLRSRSPDPVSRPPRPRVYDDAVREALAVVWEASNRICGKRLKAVLPVLIPALETHGHLSLDAVVRGRLLAASPATIDRLLASKRRAAQARRGTPRAWALAPRCFPVRAFGDGAQPEPGNLAIALVPHVGEGPAGSCAHTLVSTDLASGWTACVALPACEATLVVDGLDRLRRTLPFALRSLDSGDGRGLLDDAVRAYCGKHQIELTRSRPHHEDEHAWVRRTHGSVVRRLVGHGRLEGPRAIEGLERLYTAFQRFVNFFQPSFTLAEKLGAGARVRKRHHAPETPCARLLASSFVDDARKEQLRASLAAIDPLHVLGELRSARQHLAGPPIDGLHDGSSRRAPELARLIRGLATAWNRDEASPARRAGPRPPRHWRTRTDPFDGVWPRVAAWLEAEPDRTAKQLLQRLRDEGLGEFPDRHLRTLQRRVKEWRRAIRPARSS